MSLLLQRLVTLVLFIVVMAGWAWVLNRTVPGAVDWLTAAVGEVGFVIVFAAFLAALWLFGQWYERRHREKRGIQSGARGP